MSVSVLLLPLCVVTACTEITVTYCVFSIHDHVENNQQNALNSILLYVSFLRWLLHVSAKQCRSQGATMFLSEPRQRQYGRRQV
jgi:hypothetical protein